MLGLIATLVALSGFVSPSFSVPLSSRQTQEYHLQTKCISCENDKGTNKENLYVEAYHTGAGLNDAVLTGNLSTAAAGYLNETIQQFDLHDQLSWFFVLDAVSNYGGTSKLTFAQKPPALHFRY